MRLTITLHDKKITPEEFNSIIHFASVYPEGKLNVLAISQKTPILLDGKISELSSLGRKAFIYYNNKNLMRNIRIIERVEKWTKNWKN